MDILRSIENKLTLWRWTLYLARINAFMYIRIYLDIQEPKNFFQNHIRMLKGSIINYTYNIEILKRNICNYTVSCIFSFLFSVLFLSYKGCTMSRSLNGKVDGTLRAVFKERNFEKKKFITLHNTFFILVNSKS